MSQKPYTSTTSYVILVKSVQRVPSSYCIFFNLFTLSHLKTYNSTSKIKHDIIFRRIANPDLSVINYDIF